jgi:hypothetical protein
MEWFDHPIFPLRDGQSPYLSHGVAKATLMALGWFRPVAKLKKIKNKIKNGFGLGVSHPQAKPNFFFFFDPKGWPNHPLCEATPMAELGWLASPMGENGGRTTLYFFKI